MVDLLQVGVVAGDDDRNGESAHAEYASRSGMDVQFVQMIFGDYPAGVAMEPKGDACLLEKTDGREMDRNVPGK